MRFAWVLAVAACGGGKSGDAGASSTSDAAAGSGSGSAQRPTLSVKLDGAALALERAFVKRVSPDQWRLLVGDREGSCEELLAGVTNRQAGATSFVATIRRRLAPDGKFATVVSDFWSAGHPTEARYGAARLTVPDDGATPRGKKITVELAPIVDIDGKKKLEISGATIADGCGDHPDSGAGIPKAAHPSTATITVAGHKLALRSATIDGTSVTLSTGPKDCTTTPAAQIVVIHNAAAWELSGTWIGEVASAPDKDVKLAHRSGATSTSPDGPTVQLALTGEGTVGGYKVALTGSIEAIDCSPPPPSKKP